MPSITAAPAAYERLLARLSEELGAMDDRGLRRRLIPVEAIHNPLVRIGGRELVSWCSNDYFGLSTHPAVVEAAGKAAAEWGVGGRASRLLAGTTRWHTRLEEALASWFGAESALVYPSGYLANLGALGAVLSSADAAFVDRLAHASLVDAVRATGSTLRVFRHNDIGHLESLLSSCKGARLRVVVTEGLFSMEGDRSPLEAIAGLARRHGALVYVDDAHGAFVLGPSGRGAPEAAGVSQQQLLYMGTLGKALGCQGGFVIGPRTLINFLQNRSRTFVYTTALAVPVVAAAVAALECLARDPGRRALLQDRVRRLHDRLGPIQTRLGGQSPSPSHIMPILVGEPRRALDLAQHLWDRGMWVPAIRPPTVPRGTARLRLSISCLHTDEQVDGLAQALQGGLDRLGFAGRSATVRQNPGVRRQDAGGSAERLAACREDAVAPPHGL